MKSGMRTQLEKFHARQTKDRTDIESMMRAELEKKQRMLETLNIANEKVLSDQGSIEEAAAVISYSGMDIFASSFGNSVARIFQEEALPMVREVFREEIRSVIRGVMKGYTSRVEDEIKLLMQDLTPSDLIAPKAPEAPESVKEEETTTTIRKKIGKRTDGRKVAQTIADTLNTIGSPIKLSELKKLLPDIKFSEVTIRNAQKYAPEIKKVGYGMYTYKT